MSSFIHLLTRVDQARPIQCVRPVQCLAGFIGRRRQEVWPAGQDRRAVQDDLVQGRVRASVASRSPLCRAQTKSVVTPGANRIYRYQWR